MSEYARLKSLAEIDELVARSHETPVVFFKHSLTCPISGAAFREYQRFLADRPADDATVYTLIEVQNAREVSNEIARRTGIRHESPQALLMRGGEVVWHASHGSIRSASLKAAVVGSRAFRNPIRLD